MLKRKRLGREIRTRGMRGNIRSINSGEYKLMGLAPYGKPIFKDIILDKLIDLKEDGSFKLDMKYFNYATGLTMTNNKFSKRWRKLEGLAKKENLNLNKLSLKNYDLLWNKAKK